MRHICLFLSVLAIAARISAAAEAEIEIRLVPHDQPDITVDALDRQEEVLTPVQTPRGTEIRKIGIKAVCWCRGILLDGEQLFERYVEGKYVGRLPRSRRSLKPGRHVIRPGDHAFEVSADGKVTVASPDLAIAADGSLLIKSYPVTVRGLLCSPEASSLPLTMRLAPLPRLTVRESGEYERDEAARSEALQAGKPVPPAKARDLLPIFADFVELTIWLPANQSSKGYALYPQGITFHLGSQGIAIGAGGGVPAAPGVQVAKSEIVLPLFAYPCRGSAGAALVVDEVQKLEFPSSLNDSRREIKLYPRQRDYILRVADHGPTMRIAGDLLAMPYKALYVEKGACPQQRALLAEMAQRHFKPGDSAEVWMQAIAPGPSPKEAEAESEANFLSQATPFALLQGYGQKDWRSLEIKSAAPQRMHIVLPADADGVYRLRLGVRPADDTPELAADFWITIAPARPVALGVFSPRQRTAFYRGEEFALAVGIMPEAKAAAGAGAALAVALRDSRGQSLGIYQQTLSAPLKPQTIILRFTRQTTWALAPGRYQVIAALGDNRSRPFALDIVDSEPKTHFDNILIGKYSPWGAQYEAAICQNAWQTDHHEAAQAADLNDIVAGQGPADRLAADIVALGCNGFMGMSYEMDRVVRHGAELETVVGERRELGPAEAYALASGRDLFLDAAVRRNLRFWENLFTYNDTSLPRGEAMLGACARYAALEAQALRHSPAFAGVCLYDEFYYRSLNDGVAVVTAFEQAMEADYRARHPALTSSKAMKCLDRYTGRPLEQRRAADLDNFKTWPAWEDECWGIFSRRMVEAVRRVAPASRNFTLYRYWGGPGGSLATNGDEAQVFAPLDIAACVMYKDGGYGDRPEFAPIHADTLRLRQNLRVWTQLHNFNGPGEYSLHLLRQAFLGLSQKPDGFTYFCMANDRDAFQNIAADLCTRYGDFFLALERGYRQVAVYYSRQAHYLQMRKPYSLGHQCAGLWLGCLRAGFPADFVRDHDMLAGRAMDYAAIFVPGFFYEDECPADILAALRRLVDAGKFVFIERSSRLPLAGAIRLESNLDELDDGQGGAFPRYVDFEAEMIWDRSEPIARLVRSALAKRIPAAVRHDLIAGPDWLKRGQGEYLVVANTTYAPMTGLYKTLYQAPVRAKLAFPKRPPCAYDLLEMKRVETTIDGDWMQVEADMTVYPGKILAFLPEEIAGVNLAASPEIAAGDLLAYRVAVRGKSGREIDAAFPLEIVLVNADGEEAQRIFRAAAPEYRGAYRMPMNIRPGVWRLQVREMISGAAGEATVAVKGGGEIKVSADDRRVRIHDAERMAEFISGQGSIAIAVDDGQEWLKPMAERLASALRQRGREVEIVSAQIARGAGAWNQDRPTFDGTRLWRGNSVRPDFFVDRPLILLGRRGENRLIEALALRDVYVEPLTSHFPGPGRAVLAWTHRAFSHHCDTVSILAADADGLQAGVDAFLHLAAAPAADRPAAEPSPKYDNLVAAKDAVPARSPFSERCVGAEPVTALDLDQESGRILAGTAGYGENLFCLDAEGKLLWKTYLPEHEVHVARWYDGGKRVVAATARGWWVFLLAGDTGKVLRKFRGVEWPNMHYAEGAVRTPFGVYLNPSLKQILVSGRSGLLAVDYDGNRLWFHDIAPEVVAIPPAAEQSGRAPAFPLSASMGNLAFSPDSRRIALGFYRILGSAVAPGALRLEDVWAFRPRILDAGDGKTLLENSECPADQFGPYGWSVRWPAEAKMPWLDKAGLSLPWGEDGKLGAPVLRSGSPSDGGDSLERDRYAVARRTAGGRLKWRTEMPHLFAPSHDCVAAAPQRLYRVSWNGWALCLDLEDGKIIWQKRLPWLCRFYAAADRLIAGCGNGEVCCLDLDGNSRWQIKLAALHAPFAGDFVAHRQAAEQRDAAVVVEHFAVGEDKPGEYDHVLRFGMEQLQNRDYEEDGGWTIDGQPAAFVSPGRESKRAMRLAAGQLAVQAVNARLVPLGTYLLEFYYRGAEGACSLTAGGLVREKDTETIIGTTFSCQPGEWRFGRVALKIPAAATGLEIGFEAAGGAALVDGVSLRPVRFPSANLLANASLHAVRPTFVSDWRVQYHRIPPDLKQGLLQQSRVSAFKQGEVYGPVGGPESGGEKQFPQDPLAWPMFMASPAHVPATWPAELLGEYREIGYSHHLGPPVFGAAAAAANNLMILPTPYGNLQALRLASDDPKARLGERCALWGMSTLTITTAPAWYAARFIAGSADASVHAVAENGARLWSFKTGGRVYSAPTPMADDVFFGSDDGSLYKIDIDSGILLWEYKTKGKIRGAPAVAEGRVYVASGDGYLHAVHAESGKNVWQAALAPFTRSAAAVRHGLVAIGDEDGYMRCFRANDGQEVFAQRLSGRISACPLFTDKGLVFVSEQGHIAMVDNVGTVLWSRHLGAECSGQPVATATQAIVPSRQGVMALRLADGQDDDRLRLAGRRQQALAALPYGERLAVLYGGAETIYGQGPVTYAGYGSEAVIYAPEKR